MWRHGTVEIRCRQLGVIMTSRDIRRRPATGEVRVVRLTDRDGAVAMRVSRTDDEIVMSGSVTAQRRALLRVALRTHRQRCCEMRATKLLGQLDRQWVDVTIRCMFGLQQVIDALQRSNVSGVDNAVPVQRRSRARRPLLEKDHRRVTDDVNGGGRVPAYSASRVAPRMAAYDEAPRVWGAQSPARELQFGVIRADDARFYQKGGVVESK
jgi:hypothetical protein